MLNWKNYLKISFALICLCFTNNAQAQGPFYIGLGVGPGGGYRTMMAEYGVTAGFIWGEFYSLNVGIHEGKYQGLGVHAGVEYRLLDTKVKPILGGAYSTMGAKQFEEGEGDDWSLYSVPSRFFISGMAGVSYDMAFKSSQMNGRRPLLISIMPFASYRFFSDNAHVNLLEGAVNLDREEEIKERIDVGFGFGIRIMVFVGLKY